MDFAGDPDAGVEGVIGEVPTIAEDRETALAVLEATIEAWGSPLGGAIDTDVWQAGYQTIQRLGFIDGSVPLEDMFDPTVMPDEAG